MTSVYQRLAFLLVMLHLFTFPSHAADGRSNVLFIAVDDLNDWVGCLGGHPQSITPNIDRLADRGVLFTNAHCQAPICNPSRLSLMTGVLPSTSGVYYLAPHLRKCDSTKNALTIPQHFARNGYHTFGVGKLLHVEDDLEFQEYGGRFIGIGPQPAQPLSCGLTHPLWDWGAFPERDEQLSDTKIAEWTADRLLAKHDKPFFLACGFLRPHVPLFVPQKWFDMHPRDSIQLPTVQGGDLDDVPGYGQDLSWSAVAPRHKWMVDNQQWEHAVQAYLASITFVDSQIGKVLDALDKSGHADNTVVVLWSDHGFHMGTKERWGKRSLWEASTRVVLAISVPGGQQKQRCDRPVGLIDLYPTLIELCGLPSVVGLEGQSITRLLDDPTANWERPALTTFGQHNHAVRSQDWRYITYADGSQELYDHRNDPHEFNNLASQPELSQIIEDHRRWLPQVNHSMAPGSAHADARPGSVPDID